MTALLKLDVSPTAIARFSKKYRTAEGGCWLWTGCKHSTGYGRFGLSTGNIEYAHRAAWLLFRGPITEGLFVLHRCDVRLCVNPEHLFLGTQLDNMRDASAKGRIKPGAATFASDETHQAAKLSDAQVREIRGSNLSSAALFRSGRYPVTHASICAARKRVTFRSVT